MQELPFLHSALRLMLIDICMKFREDSFGGFQVIERTRFVTDRQTDGQTDGRPGKNNMSPNPSGGDIITKMHVVSRFLCGGLHVISAVCRDISSSEFDYAAPGAILI